MESLGILFSKECIPYAQIERVRSNVRTMRTLIRKNYRIRTPEIMLRLYKTYILPRISYCSQQWHTGLEKHVKPIERELTSFWKLCDTKMAPEDFLGLREQLILNDLVLMHRIWKGVSTISFDEFFTICDHQKNTNAEIEVKKYKKVFAKNTFAHRMHKYWNYLSLEIRNKSAGLFKKEIKDLLKNKKRRQDRSSKFRS